ncbi:hypothetical protein KCP77_10460 [Salmonella enterica subsp. enterica]|nr:hypothetical protein KCP77_10460 [Salmonella enterica subsp. enterica]
MSYHTCRLFPPESAFSALSANEDCKRGQRVPRQSPVLSRRNAGALMLRLENYISCHHQEKTVGAFMFFQYTEQSSLSSCSTTCSSL